MQNKQESPIIEHLKNLYYLPSEVVWLENDISQLKSTNDPAWAETIDLENKRINRCHKNIEMLTSVINGVNDPILRQVLALRFAIGLGWAQVALEAGGTGAACKQMAYRWARKMEKKQRCVN